MIPGIYFQNSRAVFRRWKDIHTERKRSTMKRYICMICGYVYDEAEGCPDQGIAPGTRWEDVPDDFTCPDCGVGKEDFEVAE